MPSWISMECIAMRTKRLALAALICISALVPAALAAEPISYRAETIDGGPSTPGPTDPNGPSG